MRHFDIQKPALDLTRLMFRELESDKRSTKIDLGIGIYRDEKGEAPVFKAVKKAEAILLKTEISKFNVDVMVDDESIEIKNFPDKLPENIEIDTYDDHRMALAFSPLSVLVKLIINDSNVISKSFPEYWSILKNLNFEIQFIN